MTHLQGWTIKFLVHFDGPEDILLLRMLRRAETSGRVDDNIDTFKKRFQDFVVESEPIISFYEAEETYTKVEESHRYHGLAY